MKATLMWTIDDVLAFEMLSGLTTVGRLRCPICMERTKAFTLKHYHKVSYFDCHCQFLPLNCAYKRNKNSFKKRCVETSPPPPYVSSPDMWNRVAHLPFSYDLEEEEEILGYGENQIIFWRLSYWKTNLLRHNIDVMHTKRNVFMNVFVIVMDINGTIKDTHNA
ncbi:hypothetical protein CR513_04545, partial [Mucuna pruriens]